MLARSLHHKHSLIQEPQPSRDKKVASSIPSKEIGTQNPGRQDYCAKISNSAPPEGLPDNALRSTSEVRLTEAQTGAHCPYRAHQESLNFNLWCSNIPRVPRYGPAFRE